MTLSPLVYSENLNEAVHVSYLFDKIFDDIINIIKKQVSNGLHKEEFTKFFYDPTIKDILISDNPKSSIGYPIFVKGFYGSPLQTLSIEDNDQNKIILSYNVKWIISKNPNNSVLKEKLRHEFLHVIETYVDGKIFKETSNYDIDVANIKTLMYLLNDSEINARINEACKRIENIQDNKLKEILELLKNKVEEKYPEAHVYKYMIIEELMVFLESILQLEFLRKFVVEIITNYRKQYTQDNLYYRKASLCRSAQIGYYIKKFKVIKRNKENYQMIDNLPDNLEDVRFFSTSLTMNELDLQVFNLINLLEWYINKINKRTIESLYNVIEQRKHIDIVLHQPL